MKRVHVVSDRNPCNGMFVAARLIAAREDGSRVVTCGEFLSGAVPVEADCEVWVHGCWLPCYWRCCFKVLKLRAKGLAGSEGPLPLPTVRLVRMTHANLDAVRYRFHGWKKRLVAPIERWLFAKCDRVVVTCAEEQKWCEAWGVKGPFEVIDLKRLFDLGKKVGEESGWTKDGKRSLHVLYLGRQHPLKGVTFLERAVQEINEKVEGVEGWKAEMLKGWNGGEKKPCRSVENVEGRGSDWNHGLTRICTDCEGVRGSDWPCRGVESVEGGGSELLGRRVELRVVSGHAGDELESDWAWCDVLCLPTLSDNFGLVVAEALERGKRVITTDGAPAWSPEEVARVGGGEQWQNGLVYLRGYREGSDDLRVELLKNALEAV